MTFQESLTEKLREIDLDMREQFNDGNADPDKVHAWAYLELRNFLEKAFVESQKKAEKP